MSCVLLALVTLCSCLIYQGEPYTQSQTMAYSGSGTESELYLLTCRDTLQSLRFGPGADPDAHPTLQLNFTSGLETPVVKVDLLGLVVNDRGSSATPPHWRPTGTFFVVAHYDGGQDQAVFDADTASQLMGPTSSSVLGAVEATSVTPFESRQC